ncbi:MAG: hypothetical protein A2W26_07025 [Acidobacteria bacterium RBG_16_64_8]|nr:MAG: hypothetical protein A2W26_07025 [Acidobacteria bacterium RBG_16_64_8]
MPACGMLRAWKRFARNRFNVLGGLVILVMLTVAAAAPALMPYDANDIQPEDALQAPTIRHLFGTDHFGRDLLSRVMLGARISFGVGILATLLSMATGSTLGLVAGYYGRAVDEILMRLMDILLAFPFIVLAVALMAVVGASLANVILVIALVRVPQFARLARGQVLLVKQLEFVEASRATGATTRRIIQKHVLPNILTPLVVLASLSMATAINAEAALSFLGVGIPPPTPTWGGLVAEGRRYLLAAPWISTIPGLAISLTVLGFNLLGDGLRDALDPRTA